jgi:ubiquinone/menaquinone biosynthesis C-methylase UbiE
VDIAIPELKLACTRNKDYMPEFVSFHRMDVINLAFRDESFDLIVGMSILHHVDLDKAAHEIHRILKPGGRALFTEPLAHNPISNLWRKMTPELRSKNEWPLRYREIRRIGSYFRSFECREFACLTLFSSLVYLVTFSKRWKEKTGVLLAQWEKPILKIFPPIRRFSGLVLLEFRK